MAKPLSWKWKILIALLCLIMVGIAFVLTPWGHKSMQDWITSTYEESPPEQRIHSAAADWYLVLAWWTGFVCMNNRSSQQMYQDFLGIDHNAFWQQARGGWGDPPWKGKFDPKTKTGWGILHKRSPEAFFNYLELYEASGQSGQYIKEMGINYHLLFHDMYPNYVDSTGGRPHPRFYIYWNKIKDRYIMKYRGLPPPVQPKPEEYPGPECLDKPQLLEKYAEQGY